MLRHCEDDDSGRSGREKRQRGECRNGSGEARFSRRVPVISLL